MNDFKAKNSDISYKDMLELDGCFAYCHTVYGKAPVFDKKSGGDISNKSRKNKISSKKLYGFNGTLLDYSSEDRIELWEAYWLEYINSFKMLTDVLPNSVVTIYVGRQAIEIGIKYLLLKKINKVLKTHDLGVLCDLLYSEYNIDDDYMKDVKEFCTLYCKYIEGENPEYFRYPEYKSNSFFAGNYLDLNWISYNFILIIKKLYHFANINVDGGKNEK